MRKLNFDECAIEDEHRIPESMVQITADENEIQRRIASFIELKREEINQNNVRNFVEAKIVDSCARASSNVFRVEQSTGLLRIRRIKNETGPEMESTAKQLQVPTFNGFNERLEHIEKSLNTTNSSTPKDIYQRLKTLEDQIAFLQTVSPEYSKFVKKDFSKPKKVYSISDLDSIIESMQSKT